MILVRRSSDIRILSRLIRLSAYSILCSTRVGAYSCRRQSRTCCRRLQRGARRAIINTILPLLVTPLDSVVLTPVANTVLPLLGVRLGSVDVTLKDIDVGGTELVL